MQCIYRFLAMLRRQVSSSPSPRAQKRAKLDHLTKDDFKNGVFLAPMVRSGACKCNDFSALYPLILKLIVATRLFALKHGATLVWGPEIVDKAILHSKRVVNCECILDFVGELACHLFIYSFQLTQA